MNTPPTLDRFETKLLDELRAHVATRPEVATPPPPARRPHRRGRWAAGLAAAAAAAMAYVVVSPGGPAVSPAYGVDQQADGDVVVTIHRLEDAAGLEAALRELGIDANVSFDPSNSGDTFTFQAPDGAQGEVGKPAPPGGTDERRLEARKGPSIEHQDESGIPTEVEPGEEPDPAGCGMGSSEPATLTHEGDDWVLRIPADSPLQDRPVQITTGADGQLGAFYAGSEPGSYCGVVSVG